AVRRLGDRGLAGIDRRHPRRVRPLTQGGAAARRVDQRTVKSPPATDPDMFGPPAWTTRHSAEVSPWSQASRLGVSVEVRRSLTSVSLGSANDPAPSAQASEAIS